MVVVIIISDLSIRKCYNFMISRDHLQPLFKHFVFYFNLGLLFKLLCLNNHRFSEARESFGDICDIFIFYYPFFSDFTTHVVSNKDADQTPLCWSVVS